MIIKRLFFKGIALAAFSFTLSVISYGQGFSMEENFPRQIILPDSVYKILLKDDDVKRNVEQAKDATRTIKSLKKEFFQTTRINLNNDRLPDLMVKAQSTLQGANVTRFWIFKQTKTGYVLVLEVPTHSLSILKNKSKGYRSIRCDKLSAVQLFTDYYRFDGDNYVYSWGKTRDL